MIYLANLNQTFQQQPTSCVLSSYGIIANYFSLATPVEEAFVSYCDHYGITYANRIDAENNYATHFDSEWRNQHCKGGELILALHRVSSIAYFQNNRTRFYGEFIQDVTVQLANIGTILENQAAFLSVGYNHPGGQFHNVVVGALGARQFIIRDPAIPNPNPAAGIAGYTDIIQITGIGTLRDGTLFRAMP